MTRRRLAKRNCRLANYLSAKNGSRMSWQEKVTFCQMRGGSERSALDTLTQIRARLGMRSLKRTFERTFMNAKKTMIRAGLVSAIATTALGISLYAAEVGPRRDPSVIPSSNQSLCLDWNLKTALRYP